MQQETLDRILTEREVAEYLRVSVGTVRRWRWLGVGPRFIRVSKSAVRYRLADVAAYVAGRPFGGETVQAEPVQVEVRA